MFSVRSGSAEVVEKKVSAGRAKNTAAPVTIAAQPSPAIVSTSDQVATSSTEQVVAQTSGDGIANQTTKATTNAPDMLQLRLQATQQWMRALPKDTVTIQILGSSDEPQLRSQLALLVQTIELDKIYVYQTKVNQQIFYTVVYGTYADRFSANEALKQLPASLQKNRPQLRTIGGILEETNKST